MRLMSIVCQLVIALATTTVTFAQSSYRYAFLTLPTLGGEDSYGWGINELGDVVGSAFLPGNNAFRATLWIGDVPINLGLLGDGDSRAQDVNSNGWVVGWSGFLITGNERAFLWRDGRMEDIGTLGGTTANAFAISELGDIVGSSRIDETRSGAFLWHDGVMEKLPDLADRASWAYDINSTGQIIGRSYSAESSWRAVLWDNGEIIDLGTLRPDNGGSAEAHGINDLGQIVGFAQGWAYRYYATLWYNGRIHDLGTPNTQESQAFGINNLGQVVGSGWTSGGITRAFIWDSQRGMEVLDQLVPPGNSMRPYYPWGINDAGQIAGMATPKGAPESRFLAFLMSPVNPTMEMATPSPGTAGAENTITVTGATPGARVYFCYSRHGGGTRIPGCDLQQNALQLDNPTIIGTAVADQSGNASITRNVPLIARGQTILFQAVVQNECAISQLVVHRFE